MQPETRVAAPGNGTYSCTALGLCSAAKRDVTRNMSNRLYVGNLAFDTTESGLSDAFAQCGTIQELRVVTDRDTGRSRGFAFVTMSTADEAKSAITQLDGQMLDGRALRVNEAEERQPRGGGGGGGRSNSRGW